MTSNWRDSAECLGVEDPEIFFPDTKGKAQEAKYLCRRCVVAADCFTEAIRNNERGVWGGVYFGADTAKGIKQRF